MVWQCPPGWPAPPPAWSPPPGWQPDPSWPAPPPGWIWWRDEPLPPRKATRWFIAAGVCVGLSILLLFVGLGMKGLTVVYVSIALSVLWVPLVIIGAVQLVLEDRRSRATS